MNRLKRLVWAVEHGYVLTPERIKKLVVKLQFNSQASLKLLDFLMEQKDSPVEEAFKEFCFWYSYNGAKKQRFFKDAFRTYLTRLSPDLTTVRIEKRTLWDWVILSNYPSIGLLDLLWDLGLPVDLYNQKGLTPLMVLASGDLPYKKAKRRQLIEWFLSHGARRDLTNLDEQSAEEFLVACGL